MVSSKFGKGRLSTASTTCQRQHYTSLEDGAILDRSTSVPGILFRELKHGIPLGRADFLNGESVPLLE